jgi:hypothetical protein
MQYGAQESQSVSAVDSFREGWELFQRWWKPYAVAALAFMGIMIPIRLVFTVINYVATSAIGAVVSPNGPGSEPVVFQLLVALSGAVIGLVSFPIQMYFQGGLMRLVLGYARGEELPLSTLWSSSDCFMRLVGVTLLQALAIGVGAAFCLVPGVILALGLSQATWLVVDSEIGVMDALRKSWELTNGRKLEVFVFGLITMAAAIAGLIACFVGVIPASMVIFLATAVFFLRISGRGRVDASQVAQVF